MLEERFWRAVLDRDRTYDDRFVYGVARTRIYCRPSCPSRRPRRENVRFYRDTAAAERAGYRPCMRCKPTERPLDRAAERVKQICAFIDDHAGERLTLSALGAQAGWSPFHLQRVFTRLVGISPREYAEARRVERFKSSVRRGNGIADALYGAGYGSNSRLYEKTAQRLGMTPAAYRRGARGMTIDYTICDSDLGRLLVAATGRGVCAVTLGTSDAQLTSRLRDQFSAADLRRDKGRLKRWVARILGRLDGRETADVPLDVRGTAFQWQIWKQLLAIPPGATRSYGDIARAAGRPGAARAVARACASNPVALLIPCHRVTQADGGLGGYRWGVERKAALLEREKR
jgi:AraC family transcriptional regulator of adaptative response/methylated-DNA-[protein]-cysteine methyltransferase